MTDVELVLVLDLIRKAMWYKGDSTDAHPVLRIELSGVIEGGPFVDMGGAGGETYIAEIRVPHTLDPMPSDDAVTQMVIDKCSIELWEFMDELNAGKFVIENFYLQDKDEYLTYGGNETDGYFPLKITTYIYALHLHWFPLCRYDEFGWEEKDE